MNARTRFETHQGGQYLATMCKHFARKLDTEWDGTSGWIEFPFGRCEISAGATWLEMTASADTQVQLGRVVEVVTRHLERFAFRENPTLTWTGMNGPSFGTEPTA